MRNPNVECLVCSKKVYRRTSELRKNKGRVFCSQKCYGVSNRITRPCVTCGKEILAGRNAKTCSKECFEFFNKSVFRKHSLGRKKIDNPKWGTRSFRTKFLEERGRACEFCGYNKTQVLQIHHIIERHNGGSDDYQNLKLVCRNCHGEIHFGLRAC